MAGKKSTIEEAQASWSATKSKKKKKIIIIIMPLFAVYVSSHGVFPATIGRQAITNNLPYLEVTV